MVMYPNIERDSFYIVIIATAWPGARTIYLTSADEFFMAFRTYNRDFSFASGYTNLLFTAGAAVDAVFFIRSRILSKQAEHMVFQGQKLQILLISLLIISGKCAVVVPDQKNQGQIIPERSAEYHIAYQSNHAADHDKARQLICSIASCHKLSEFFFHVNPSRKVLDNSIQQMKGKCIKSR